ncbi:type I-C CRISPR-associated protein Cas8c/Csd1 [Agathobaculum sp.]|uniref:type I-C CRISPR-associated protein Cas8c/Csd1 n=1 Tax=Agathobaculum sp. TaxID=2048138 RepID=UPI002A7F1778|nr:type I-C CRISPR-associated protein Cas8c/Csd1 [Agathobaculum sp.]MDY3617580.1 type I-C CRISPR-associated protein Cas8c/Csd1 [Agathobaculum sp.]
MGLLAAAYRTYQTQAHRVGVMHEGEKEPLTPVSHIVQNAQLEITISDGGVFQSASPVPKEDAKTIIPATIESANRTSAPCPHPLCDQLAYLTPDGGGPHETYVAQLEAWASSAFTHPKVQAVLRYIKGGSVIADLTAAGLILPEDKPDKYGKWLVRWRVLPKPENTSAECWRDTTLFDSFTQFYAAQCEGRPKDLCMVSGRQDMFCSMHQKGVVAKYGNAKLISSNDHAGFTYRGRFVKAEQAVSVGYTASQQAHSALRWVAANHGVMIGGRTFLCWNPDGREVPSFSLFGFSENHAPDFPSYRKNLLETLGGYRQKLEPADGVVVAALDAATPGRLSVTYYNELRGSDFLDRIERWYDTFCVDSGRFGVHAPSLRRIVDCAFGTEKGQFIEADERVQREHIQQLLPCLLDGRPLPADIVRALAARAGMPLAYSRGNRKSVLDTACAVIRKYHNDKKEEWTLALDTSCTDRSYLFGRLLAVAEKVERSTYGKEEGRETNAIRMQTVFAQRPLYAWRILGEQLNPYFARLTPNLRAWYKNIISEITDKLDWDDPSLNQKLDDVYLLGYYHQRAARGNEKDTTETEEKEHEQTAE